MMNRIMKPLFTLVLITLLSGQAFGIRGLNGTVGLGYPEAANLGLRFVFLNAQLGVHAGLFPQGPNNSYFSAGAAAYYHFAGSSYWVKQKPFYARLGFDYVREEVPTDISQNGYLDFRAGRVMNISKRMGMELDAGFGIKLFENLEPENSQNTSPPIRLSLGLRWFFRF
jgi:hypothetical protein